MKTFFLSLPYGMSARNFLRSDFYPTLKKNNKLIVFTPLANDAAFKSEFNDPNVVFEHVPQIANPLLTLISKILSIIQGYWFTRKHSIKTLEVLEGQLRAERPLRYALYWLIAAIGRLPPIERLLLTAQRLMLVNIPLTSLIARHKPDLIFVSHGFVQEEVEIALVAKKLKIPVTYMVHSWDNLTCKSGLKQITSWDIGRMLPVDLYGRFITWNEVLAQELVELYNVPRERIDLSGIPQFDVYTSVGKQSTRKNFLKGIGADPDKKLIYYLATSPTIVHDQLTVIRGIVTSMRAGRFGAPCQLLIRFHPRTDMSGWVTEFKGPDVFFQQPSVAYSALPVNSGWQPEKNNTSDLGESLFYADVVINAYSTTAIDAAAFDKPVICVGYDGDTANQQMVDNFYATTHYSKLLQRGGITVASSPRELEEAIDAYLKDPHKDADGRARIRADYIYKLDGHSGARVAEILLKNSLQ